MTHDRVVRFAPVFDTREQAMGFANAQSLAWFDERRSNASGPVSPFFNPKE